MQQNVHPGPRLRVPVALPLPPRKRTHSAILEVRVLGFGFRVKVRVQGFRQCAIEHIGYHIGCRFVVGLCVRFRV